MELVQDNEYSLGTMDNDDLGLWHQGIKQWWVCTHVFPAV